MKHVVGLLALIVSFGVVADDKDTVWLFPNGTIVSISVSDPDVKALAAWRDSFVGIDPRVDPEKCQERIVVDSESYGLITKAIDNQRYGGSARFLIEHGNAPARGGCVLRGIRQ